MLIKKTKLVIIVSELGSKPNPHMIDKVTMKGLLKTSVLV